MNTQMKKGRFNQVCHLIQLDLRFCFREQAKSYPQVHDYNLEKPLLVSEALSWVGSEIFSDNSNDCKYKKYKYQET